MIIGADFLILNLSLAFSSSSRGIFTALGMCSLSATLAGLTSINTCGISFEISSFRLTTVDATGYPFFFHSGKPSTNCFTLV